MLSQGDTVDTSLVGRYKIDHCLSFTAWINWSSQCNIFLIIIVMIHDLGREDDAHVAEVDVDCAEVFAVAWAARQDRDLWQVLQ